MANKESEKRQKETLESSRQRFAELMHNRWFWLAAGAVALGAAGTATWQAIEWIKKREEVSSASEEEDALSSLINETLLEVEINQEGVSAESFMSKFARRALSLFEKEERGLDIRHLFRLIIHPLRRTEEEVGNLRREISPEVLNGIDSAPLRRFLGQTEFRLSEMPSHFEQELRRGLVEKGYRVTPLPLGKGQDWEETGRILKRTWPFPSLRQRRHGIMREGADFGPADLIFPQGWLVVKKDSEGMRKVVAYVSFLALEDLDLKEIDFANFSFTDALVRQAKVENREDFVGKTLMVTSVTKDTAANTDAVVAGILGLKDFAKDRGVARVIAPALSPFVKQRQEESGGSFANWWLAVDGEGISTDRWRLLLAFFSLRELPVNEHFLDFKVRMEEVLFLLSQNRNAGELSTGDVSTLLSQETLFLDASPVPLKKEEDGQSYQVTIPAGWLLFYDQNLESPQEDKRVSLFRERLWIDD